MPATEDFSPQSEEVEVEAARPMKPYPGGLLEVREAGGVDWTAP